MSIKCVSNNVNDLIDEIIGLLRGFVGNLEETEIYYCEGPNFHSDLMYTVNGDTAMLAQFDGNWCKAATSAEVIRRDYTFIGYL